MPSKNITRRNFLSSSALGLIGTATALGSRRPMAIHAVSQAASAAHEAPTTDLPGAAGEIMRWVTNEKLRFARVDPIRWQPKSGAPPDNNVVLNEEKTFQDILGFGAAFTEASCFTFSRLTAPEREQLFHELFHSSEMGLDVCRTCIGSSDYSIRAYTYDEGKPDPELNAFPSSTIENAYFPYFAKPAKQIPICFCFHHHGVLQAG